VGGGRGGRSRGEIGRGGKRKWVEREVENEGGGGGIGGGCGWREAVGRRGGRAAYYLKMYYNQKMPNR